LDNKDVDSEKSPEPKNKKKYFWWALLALIIGITYR
jgi:hypothetical protein